MEERTYPCTAVGKQRALNLRGQETEWDLAGVKITVLTKAEYHCCCCSVAHKVELPNGHPEPPEHCETWMIGPENLIFEDEK